MPRKKKEQIEIKEPVKVPVKDPVMMDFGTGWTGKNNMIQFAISKGELREVRKNE